MRAGAAYRPPLDCDGAVNDRKMRRSSCKPPLLAVRTISGVAG
jgi:hypothetical protein